MLSAKSKILHKHIYWTQTLWWQGTIFISDLPQETAYAVMVTLSADHTKVYRSNKSMGHCISLQTMLTNLNERSQRNNIPFNASKCKALTVTRKRNPLTYNYHLNRVQLKRATNEKDVGVTHILSWDQHVHTITSKERAKMDPTNQ